MHSFEIKFLRWKKSVSLESILINSALLGIVSSSIFRTFNIVGEMLVENH